MPLAMVFVLGPKPHIQVLTLQFITKRSGDVPEMPIVWMRNQGQTMGCLAQGPLRLAEGCLWAEQRRLGPCLGLKPL